MKSSLRLGAVNSPQILLNSGIGPREELNAAGVPVVRDLPGVGKNLHNHVAYTLTFTINDTDTTPLNWATAMEYLLFRDGLMSGTGETERLFWMFTWKIFNCVKVKCEGKKVCIAKIDLFTKLKKKRLNVLRVS